MGSRKRLFIRILCIVAVLSFAFSQIATQTTTLTIYSNVCGFEVWWDGKHIFTTPPDKDWCWFYCVSTGRHTITLKKSGCADATVVVNIVSGQNEITVNMACGSGGSGGTKDSDGDGVTDDKDRCGNSDCIIVDSQGCPKDSDSDGINDCDDKCPYEKGVASNDGCQPASSDKDSDGVNDDRDSCYNPGCSIVDSQGCPKDSDSDGINDCDDDCRYENGPASNDGCPEDYSTNILKYWWVIAVLIAALGVLIFMSQKRSLQS